jgi:hypothetical protein
MEMEGRGDPAFFFRSRAGSVPQPLTACAITLRMTVGKARSVI